MFKFKIDDVKAWPLWKKIAGGVAAAVLVLAGLKVSLDTGRAVQRDIGRVMSGLVMEKQELGNIYKEQMFDVARRGVDAPGLAYEALSRSALSAPIGKSVSVESWAANPGLPEDRKIIRQGFMNIEVGEFKPAFEEVLKSARSFGADLFASESENPEGRGCYGSLTFLVDPSQLDELVEALGGIGTVKSMSLSSQDVTDAFVDLKSRLNSAEKVSQRMAEILRTQTGKLKEILEVERELARVGETIEVLKGQIRRMESQTSRSRLQVRLFEKSTQLTPPTNGLLLKLQQTLNLTWNVFFNIASGIFVLFGYLLGLGLYAALIWLGVRTIARVLANRKKKEGNA